MAIVGNRYLQGNPILPYANVKAYAGSDVFMDQIEFTDHTGAAVVPTAIQLEIDDITNGNVMFGPVTLTAGGAVSGQLLYPAFAAAWYLQIVASVMQMTYPFAGSQQCQFKFSFTAVDSVTGQLFTAPAIAMVELCAAATVSGTF